MADGSIFPAFAKLAYQPDDSAKSGFLRAVSETVSEGNRKLSDLGKGIDPLAGMTAVMKRQLDELTNSLSKGAGADLGAAAAQKAAAAAGLRAAAARDLASATEQAARATGDESREAQAAIAAASALAAQEELAAKAARDHAAALGVVQASLDKVAAESGIAAGAIGRTSAANDNAHASAGRFRAGAQQLGFQVSDLGVQLSMAANSANIGKMAMMAFGQQLPQVIQAVALMQGEAKGLTAFLAGPWGAALIAGGTLLGTLALAHYGAADASKTHADAATDLEKAIGDLHDATVKESRSAQASIAVDIDKANGLRQRAQEARKAAIAELQLAQQRAKSINDQLMTGPQGDNNPVVQARAGTREESNVADLQAQIDKLNANIAASNETIRLKRATQIRQSVAEQTDPAAAAAGQYERAMDRLNTQREKGRISEDAYRSEVLKVTLARDAATEATHRASQAHERHARATSGAAAATREEAAAQRELKATTQALTTTFAALAKAQGDMITAGTATGWQRMLDDLGAKSDARLLPFRQAANDTAAWRAELEAVLGNLGEIGGFAGTIGKVIGGLTGKPGAIGGPGGVLLNAALSTTWTGTDKSGNQIIVKLGEQLDRAFGKGGSLAKTLQGAAIGSAGASLIFGSQGNNPGSAIGGALGEKLGEKFLSKGFETIAKGLGSAAGPIGSIVGGLIGGALGSLFSSKPHGSGSVSNTGVTSSANNDSVRASIDTFGLSLQQSIDKVAEQLGGSVGSYSVGLGRYKDYYQVSSSGNDPVLGQTYFDQKSPNALYDGLDPQAAMRAAIADAIADGAIQGVRAGTQALLKAGTDIQAQLQKALDFENVFSRLKAYTDPVGAALDTLDREFRRLKSTFTEAGATAAEYADLEKLYGIERAKAVKAATEQTIASLQSLYDQLTMGNDALSLRDRKAAALATYQPLEDRVKAGDVTAYDDYAKAAQQLLDIERQMSGSQNDYFALADEISSLSKTQINAATTMATASANRDSPFSTSTVPANDNASVTSAINGQTSALLDGLGGQLAAVNQNLGRLIASQGGAGVKVAATTFGGVGNW